MVNNTSLRCACISTLERMGSVVRVLTTFCTFCKPAKMSFFATVNFVGITIPHEVEEIKINTVVTGLAVNIAKQMRCQGSTKDLERLGGVKWTQRKESGRRGEKKNSGESCRNRRLIHGLLTLKRTFQVADGVAQRWILLKPLLHQPAGMKHCTVVATTKRLTNIGEGAISKFST